MNTSRIRVQNQSDISQIKEKLKHIGGGEIEFWKYTVLTDPAVFDEVLCLISQEDQQIAWRAAWIIDNATEKYPELLRPHIPAIIDLLLQTNNSSLQRIFTRILIRHKIPDHSIGTIFDRCFQLLSPVHPIGVRANAMQVLYNISEQWPDLKPELSLVISGMLEEAEEAGIISKARNLLKKLRKTE